MELQSPEDDGLAIGKSDIRDRVFELRSDIRNLGDGRQIVSHRLRSLIAAIAIGGALRRWSLFVNQHPSIGPKNWAF